MNKERKSLYSKMTKKTLCLNPVHYKVLSALLNTNYIYTSQIQVKLDIHVYIVADEEVIKFQWDIRF